MILNKNDVAKMVKTEKDYGLVLFNLSKMGVTNYAQCVDWILEETFGAGNIKVRYAAPKYNYKDILGK